RPRRGDPKRHGSHIPETTGKVNPTSLFLDREPSITKYEIGFTFCLGGPAMTTAQRKSAITLEHLDVQLDVTYNWGYEKTRQDLRDLYKKAQRSQWLP